MNFIIVGCGALGSRIALELAGQYPDAVFYLIDDDVVKPENIGTSAYFQEQVGMQKVIALAELLYRKAAVKALPVLLTIKRSLNIASYVGPTYNRDDFILIDSLDNMRARSATVLIENTLHVGVGQNGTGEVVWEDKFELPEYEHWTSRGDNRICTHQLGQQLLQYTAAVAVGVIREYTEHNNKRSVVVHETMEVIDI